jgi:hypothetical protein
MQTHGSRWVRVFRDQYFLANFGGDVQFLEDLALEDTIRAPRRARTCRRGNSQ